MKIVHVTQYFNDQMGYQENVLPRYQMKLGHDVSVVTSTRCNGFTNKNRRHMRGSYLENDIPVNRLGIIGEVKNRFVVFNNLRSKLNQEQPDYIFHHSATAPSLLSIWRYKRANPKTFVVVDNHADLTNSGKIWIWRFIYYRIFWRNILKLIDPCVDIYFGVTPSRCLFLIEELSVDPKKVRLLPMGADTCAIQSAPDRGKIREKYGVFENNTVIIHGGKMSADKKTGKLLEAFARVSGSHLRLILFGSILDPELRKMIDSDSRVHFVGWLSRRDTLELMSSADFGIWHNFHSTLIEDCIAAGLPLIVKYYGSTCHLVQHSGLFIYGDSVREIQDRMEIALDSQAIEKFRMNAAIVREQLDYQSIAKESIKYFNSGVRYDGKYEHLRDVEFSDPDFPGFR